MSVSPIRPRRALQLETDAVRPATLRVDLRTYGADRFEAALVSPATQDRGAPEALLRGRELGDLVRGGLNALLGRDSTGLIGWMQKDGALPPTRDITGDFRSTYAALRTGANPLPAEARDHVYLTVDGLTGENWPGYMEANREALRDRGLDVREIKVDTEAATLTNVETIRKGILAVAAEGKQVVLIGHSKGGVDITAALARYPELKPHVRAVVAMQSPYGGAPLATDLLSNPATRLGVAALAKGLFRGDPRSVRDLTYAYRQQFIRDNPYPADIPTVSLATTSTSQLSLLAAPSNYTRLRYDEKTDGLVSDKDAMIPGSNVVRLDDVDHVNSTLPNLKQLSNWEPGDLTVALVAMALKYPPVVQPARAAAAA